MMLSSSRAQYRNIMIHIIMSFDELPRDIRVKIYRMKYLIERSTSMRCFF